MNINEVYEFLQYVSDKDQSGNLTPKEFNISMPRALNEWVLKQYNNVNNPSPTGKGWQNNQSVTDNLRFLLKKEPLAQVNSEGVLDLPDDYLHISSIIYNVKTSENGNTVVQPKSVDIAKDNEVASFTGSYIYKKRIDSKRYAIASFVGDTLVFKPKNIGVVELNYLRKPIDPFWSYTLDQSGRPVYDPINSVDLEVPDRSVNEVVMMAASYLGINLRDKSLIDYAEMQKQKGV